MLNLTKLWQNLKKETTNPVFPDEKVYIESTKSVAISFDKKTLQSSLEFDTPPTVKFVESLMPLKLTDKYDDLQALSLSSDEEAIRQAVIFEKKAQNPKFYDGQQMLIEAASYEESSNTVYLQAKKVPYSIIVCLAQKRFPEDSQLYQLSLFKVGVLAPLMCKGGETILMQRSADTLFSVPAGFLEPQDVDKRLNLEGNDNIVCATAKTEIIEEIAGIKGKDDRRFDFSDPIISAISFRTSQGNPIGTIEFVAPSFANRRSEALIKIIEEQQAEDADEHTNVHTIVPLDSSQRDDLLKRTFKSDPAKPGAALYSPVLLSLARVFNQSTCSIALPRQVPEYSSCAYPIGLFQSRIPKQISYHSQNKYDELSLGRDSAMSPKNC